MSELCQYTVEKARAASGYRRHNDLQLAGDGQRWLVWKGAEGVYKTLNLSDLIGFTSLTVRETYVAPLPWRGHCYGNGPTSATFDDRHVVRRRTPRDAALQRHPLSSGVMQVPPITRATLPEYGCLKINVSC